MALRPPPLLGRGRGWRGRAVLLLLSGTAAGSELADDDTAWCLLSLRASRHSVETGTSQVDGVASAARAWATSHAPRHVALAASAARLSRPTKAEPLGVDLDSFIDKSRQSTDSCHARQFEAKRTLDGLTHQVTALSEQMSSQTRVVETSTVAIEQAIVEKHSADDDLAAALQACAAGSNTTLLLQYRSHLDSLEQMADPEVDAAAGPLTLSAAQCERFVAQQRLRRGAYDKDCRTTAVQLDFAQSYSAVHHLYRASATAVAEALDDCRSLATSSHEARIAGVDTVIQDGTRSILAAKGLINELDPLLDDVVDTTAKVQGHVTWIEQNCQVETAFTDHLRKVRDLISTLEACPGRNDFKLAVPPSP